MPALLRLLLFLVSLAGIVLAGCNLAPTPTRTAVSVPQQIATLVGNGATLVEVPAPKLDFPLDVYPAQVKKYFRLNDDHFALVLQPSMNVPLDMGDLRPTFVGVLYAPAKEKVWRKLFLIDAAVPGDKNNPYYMWITNNALYVSVVDQTGAGSGEGKMKLLKLDTNGDWKLEGCYYFGGSYNGPETDGDYFAFSSQLDKHQGLPLDQCANWGSLRYSKV